MPGFRAIPAGIVFDGQSLNWTPSPTDNLPIGVQTSLGLSAGSVLNKAIPGTPWSTLDDDIAVRCWPYANMAKVNAFVMNGGQSDINNGTSGASLYALHVSIAGAARTAGFDKVVAVTMCPSTWITGSPETQRAAFNEALLADASNAFDDVVDLATVSGLDNPASANYLDGLHWSSAGTAIATAAVAPSLLGLLT